MTKVSAPITSSDVEFDERLRALSNATRRTILHICSDSFVAAGDVAAQINLAPASVSEHLKVLRKSGLIDLQREGTMWRYRSNTSCLEATISALAAELIPHQTERTHP